MKKYLFISVLVLFCGCNSSNNIKINEHGYGIASYYGYICLPKDKGLICRTPHELVKFLDTTKIFEKFGSQFYIAYLKIEECNDIEKNNIPKEYRKESRNKKFINEMIEQLSKRISEIDQTTEYYHLLLYNRQCLQDKLKEYE